MHRVDNATSANLLPTPKPVGPNPNGYFQPQTIVEDDFMNAVQEELCSVIETAGLTLDKANPNQLLAALILMGLDDASTLFKGIVELATNAETQAGTDAVRAVTPAGLQSKIATDIARGIVELATNAETQAGTDAVRAVTPAGLASLYTAANVLAKLLTVDGTGSGLDADVLRGAIPSETFSSSTIAKRNASGHLLASYFQTTANFTTVLATALMIETGSDGFIRRQTPAQFLANHGVLRQAFLDQPETIHVAALGAGSWSALTFATLASAGAKTAIIRVNVEHSVILTSSSLLIKVYARKTGLAIAADINTLVLAASDTDSDTGGSNGAYAAGTCEFSVNVNSSGQFDIYHTGTTSGPDVFDFTLVGYLY